MTAGEFPFTHFTRICAAFYFPNEIVKQLHEVAINTKSCNTHTHTQPFNGSFSGTTRVGRYQKGKTNLDLTEARDGE